MSTSEVFQQFYVKLVSLLPMNDSLFLAELFKCGLLSMNFKEEMEAKITRANKAAFFLDHRINSELSAGYSESFTKLLNLMEDCGHHSLKLLTSEIRAALKGQLINWDNVSG